ncbi:MAG: T9SS type A sorting domain-containing protein [Flavobacterium sp.]|nr:T9SS type A sorting domain-containing protein [Flavobacterium sp.]
MRAKLFLSLFLTTSLAFSQSYQLDTSFGTDGKTVTEFDPNFDAITSIILYPDGKILGSVNLDYSIDGTTNIVRFNVDGSYDSTFGTNGVVITSIINEVDYGHTIALQSDGKIVVSGSRSINNNATNFNFAVARYNSDGTPDTTFGLTGLVQTDFNNNFDNGRAVAIQADGKIILAGETQMSNADKQHFGVVRYNTDGSIDTSFGINGLVTAYFPVFGNSFSYPVCVRVMPDDKILIGGGNITDYLGPLYDTDTAFLKLNSDGTPDVTFGTDGLMISGSPVYEAIYTFEMTANNKIIAAGYSLMGEGIAALVQKFDAAGNPDSGFGTDGLVQILAHENITKDNITNISITPEGKIKTTGSSYNGSNYDVTLMQLNADGTLDNTFDADGIFTFDFANSDEYGNNAFGLPDGKVIFCGATNSGSSFNSFIARFLPENLAVVNVTFNNIGVYPSPFTDFISIDFMLPDPQYITIDLFDVSGKNSINLIKGKLFGSGFNSQKLPVPTNLSNGIYFLTISDGKNTKVLKITK